MSLVQVLGPSESGLLALANCVRDYLARTFIVQKYTAMAQEIPTVGLTGWKQREQQLNQKAVTGANRILFIPGTLDGDLGRLRAPRPGGRSPYPTPATVGKVLGVIVTAPGSGYVAPSIAFSAPPPGGTTATGTVQIDGSGHVVGVTVTNAGKGYTQQSLPVATISDTGGSGAELTIQVSGAGRILWTWERRVTASIWSIGKSSPPSATDTANEELQIRASDAMVELFLDAAHNAGTEEDVDPGTGNILEPRLRRDPKVSANMSYGLEVLVEFTHLEPFFGLPNDFITDVSPTIVKELVS